MSTLHAPDLSAEQLELVEVVPRNPAGKILKQALRERYAPASNGGRTR